MNNVTMNVQRNQLNPGYNENPTPVDQPKVDLSTPKDTVSFSGFPGQKNIRNMFYNFQLSQLMKKINMDKSTEFFISKYKDIPSFKVAINFISQHSPREARKLFRKFLNTGREAEIKFHSERFNELCLKPTEAKFERKLFMNEIFKRMRDQLIPYSLLDKNGQKIFDYGVTDSSEIVKYQLKR